MENLSRALELVRQFGVKRIFVQNYKSDWTVQIGFDGSCLILRRGGSREDCFKFANILGLKTGCSVVELDAFEL